MFYLDLFRGLEQREIRYLLVGGLAMNLHGVPRMTMDVDIVLLMESDNVEAFIELAKDMHLRPVPPVAIESLSNKTLLQTWTRDKGLKVFALKGLDAGSPTVDVLVDHPLDVEQALQRAIVRQVGDVHVPLAAIEDLIRLKSGTGRAQDQSDIEHLRRLRDRNP